MIYAAIGGVAIFQSSALAVLTPEDRADSGTGRIPNPSTLEYYLGPISAGASTDGFLVPRVAGQQANLAWYKYTADGATGVVFDTFGSSFGFGGGVVLSARNDSELALFDSQGRLVASTEGVRAPATYESNPIPVAPGVENPLPLGANAYRQPEDPRFPAVSYISSGWSGNNVNGLSQLAFVRNAQANPVWNPNHPQHSPNGDWDEYPILPAGDYFLALSGYSTVFSGNPRDDASVTSLGASFPFADGPVTPATPFGFVTMSAHSGIYQLNARLPGDLNLDGVVNNADRNLIKAKILEFAATKGIANAGFVNDDPNNDWEGLPADLWDPGSELQRFDLTGNSRIDIHDFLQFARWTALAGPIVGDANLDDAVDFADLLIVAQNYGRTDDRLWTDGDFSFDRGVSFDDLLGLAQNYGIGTVVAGDFDTDWQLARSLVPEPTSMIALGAIQFGWRRRRRNDVKDAGVST